MGFLIDTCIWIEVEQGILAPAQIAELTGKASIYLSPVTIAELKFGVECAATPTIRKQRMTAFSRIRSKPVLRIDETTGEIFGSLAASLKISGKAHRPRIQDLWLASQAIQHNFSLLTRNLHDFSDIPGLRIATI